MQISGDAHYLVLHTEAKVTDTRVEILDSFQASFENWDRGSRISPIWKLTDDGGTPPAPNLLKGEYSVLLLGPCNPAKLISEIDLKPTPDESVDIWVTTGLLNVVVLIKSEGASPKRERIISWVRAEQYGLEQWALSGGKIASEIDVSDPRVDKEQVQKSISELAQSPTLQKEPILKPTLMEYCSIMASAVSRSASMSPYFFDELCSFHSFVNRMCKEFESGESGLTALHMQSRLLNINAALSRFTSQTFSGVPPVLATECHFWTHSLLGTGSANMALAHIAKFAELRIGSWRIPERVSALASKKSDVPTYDELTSDTDIISNAGDVLGSAESLLSPEQHSQNISPIITYFSGRDGFSSLLQTLSAPLTTITGSNSHHSSLLTITHEISHIFVKGILTVIYPDMSCEEEINKSLEMLVDPTYQADNWLDAIKQLLVETILSMHSQKSTRKIRIEEFSTSEWAAVLKRWRHEVQEILVHTFDYLYFYGGEEDSIDFYVESIWQSWSSIPDIGGRVEEYLLRTLCAISPQVLSHDPSVRYESSKLAVEKSLNNLIGMDLPHGGYVENAKQLLLERWFHDEESKSIHKSFASRIGLVRLVQLFLYSSELSAELRGDWAVGAKDRDYGFKTGHYSQTAITNPIRFLTSVMKKKSSEAESLWVLHQIAFNCNPEQE
ncbi:MAG: hypothetical protein ABJN22_04830 [Litorimonas sp.]